MSGGWGKIQSEMEGDGGARAERGRVDVPGSQGADGGGEDATDVQGKNNGVGSIMSVEVCYRESAPGRE